MVNHQNRPNCGRWRSLKHGRAQYTIDRLSKIVLDNVKIPTENACQLIPFLRKIQQAYGDPIALVHDMGSAILHAVEAIFPGIPDDICHFHFLKDIGNDLFGHDYSTIRRHLRTHRIRSQLQKMAKGINKAIVKIPDNKGFRTRQGRTAQTAC